MKKRHRNAELGHGCLITNYVSGGLTRYGFWHAVLVTTETSRLRSCIAAHLPKRHYNALTCFVDGHEDTGTKSKKRKESETHDCTN